MASSFSSGMTTLEKCEAAVEARQGEVKECQAEVKECQAQVQKLAATGASASSLVFKVADQAFKDAKKRLEKAEDRLAKAEDRLAKAEDHQRTLELRAADASAKPVLFPADEPDEEQLLEKARQVVSSMKLPEIPEQFTEEAMLFSDKVPRPAVQEILESFELKEHVTLVGVSGCGKTGALVALARNKLVCYFECTSSYERSAQGMEDRAFAALVRDVTTMWGARFSARQPEAVWDSPEYKEFLLDVDQRMFVEVLARCLILECAYKKTGSTLLALRYMRAHSDAAGDVADALQRYALDPDRLRTATKCLIKSLQEEKGLIFAIDEVGLGFSSKYLCLYFRGRPSTTVARGIATPLVRALTWSQGFTPIVVAGTDRNIMAGFSAVLKQTTSVTEVHNFPLVKDPAAVMKQMIDKDVVDALIPAQLQLLVGRGRLVASAIDDYLKRQHRHELRKKQKQASRQQIRCLRDAVNQAIETFKEAIRASICDKGLGIDHLLKCRGVNVAQGVKVGAWEAVGAGVVVVDPSRSIFALEPAVLKIVEHLDTDKHQGAIVDDVELKACTNLRKRKVRARHPERLRTDEVSACAKRAKVLWKVDEREETKINDSMQAQEAVHFSGPVSSIVRRRGGRTIRPQGGSSWVPLLEDSPLSPDTPDSIGSSPSFSGPVNAVLRKHRRLTF